MRLVTLCVIGCLTLLLASCTRGAPHAGKPSHRAGTASVSAGPSGAYPPQPITTSSRSVGGRTSHITDERHNKFGDFAREVATEIVADQVWNLVTPNPAKPSWPGRFGGLDYPYITDVDPVGWAAIAGVRPGDIFLNYNGVDLAAESSRNSVLQAAVNEAAANRQQFASIIVSRNGQVFGGIVPVGVRLGITYYTSR